MKIGSAVTKTNKHYTRIGTVVALSGDKVTVLWPCPNVYNLDKTITSTSSAKSVRVATVEDTERWAKRQDELASYRARLMEDAK